MALYTEALRVLPVFLPYLSVQSAPRQRGRGSGHVKAGMQMPTDTSEQRMHMPGRPGCTQAGANTLTVVDDALSVHRRDLEIGRESR